MKQRAQKPRCWYGFWGVGGAGGGAATVAVFVRMSLMGWRAPGANVTNPCSANFLRSRETWSVDVRPTAAAIWRYVGGSGCVSKCVSRNSRIAVVCSCNPFAFIHHPFTMNITSSKSILGPPLLSFSRRKNDLRDFTNDLCSPMLASCIPLSSTNHARTV